MSRGMRLLIYDASEKRPLGWTWRAGEAICNAMHWFDDARGCSSWGSALAWVLTITGGRKIDDLRFWGHGNWGRVYLAGVPLTHLSVERESSPHHRLLQQLRTRLHPASRIWLRTCSTFATPIGHRFATSWADFFGCRVAGHTHKIGYWQSGTHSVAPGGIPSWPASEGVLVRDGKKVLADSSPCAPNTVHFYSRDFPVEW